MQILMNKGKIIVPDNPTIPFIEGDGIGREITTQVQKIIDSAVEKSYSGKKKIDWLEVLAGEKAFTEVGSVTYTNYRCFRNHLVGIRDP